MLLLLAIILAFIGGSTFSKYITQIQAQGSADIAKWSFKVNGSDSQIQNINLSSTFDNETLVGGKIAPGTSGSFFIDIDATDSDVGIDYKVEFSNESQRPQNLRFIYDGCLYADLQSIQEKLQGTINATDEDKTKSYRINWVWYYEFGDDNEIIEESNIKDTNDGKTLSNYTFDVVVTGTQVTPTK